MIIVFLNDVIGRVIYFNFKNKIKFNLFLSLILIERLLFYMCHRCQTRDSGRGFFHIGTVRSLLYRIWVCPGYGIRGTKASEASMLDTLLGTAYVGVL